MAANFYETDKALSEYLLFHYGAPLAPGLDFPVQCVRQCLARARRPGRALDLGCAVGRSSFELARQRHEVVGIDNSHAFIAAADRLRRRGSLSFDSVVEGDLTVRLTVRAAASAARARVRFEVGDAMSLRADLGVFDVVLMANLIDRLPDPRRCLAQLPALVRPGGQLVIASPYTWLEAYTPRDKWLGGFKRGRREVRTFETLGEILSPDFDLVQQRDLPFVIREHARKFQFGLSHATVWKRKKS